jgi:antirestriction protein
MIATENNAPRVWVGCLACYNGGRLVGAWVDAAEAADMAEDFDAYNGGEVWSNEFDNEQRRAHLAEGHEEFWCFDHGNMRGLVKGECSPTEAQRIGALVEAIQADGHDVAAVADWAGYTGEILTGWDRPTREAFEDAYQGEHDSEEAFAQQLAHDLDGVTGEESWPLSCIDWERAARDLFLGGDYYAVSSPGGVYVFRPA